MTAPIDVQFIAGKDGAPEMETAKKNRKATLQKIAEAMDIDYLQLKI